MVEALPFVEQQDLKARIAVVGAFVAAKVAASHKMKFALGIGVLFLLGGIMMVSMFGGPLWFTVVDLIGAYLPMGSR